MIIGFKGIPMLEVGDFDVNNPTVSNRCRILLLAASFFSNSTKLVLSPTFWTASWWIPTAPGLLTCSRLRLQKHCEIYNVCVHDVCHSI